MKKTSLIALLLFSLTAFAQSKEEKVWSRVEALTKAVFETKDSAALEDLVSSHVTYGHSTGVIEDKKLMMKNALSNPLSYKNISFEKISINVRGKVAVLRHNLRATTIENGVEGALNLGILQVWKKEGGKWRIWGRQGVKIAPKS